MNVRPRVTWSAPRYIAAVAGLIGIVACGDPAAPESATQPRHVPTRALAAVQPAGAILTRDDEDARIAREEIPGYAGAFADGESGVVLSLADTSRAGEKRATFEQRLAASGRTGNRGRVTRVRKVTWDFNELKSYRDVVHSQGLGGDVRWTMLDVNEAENRVTIGVLPGSDLGAARRAAVALGIPQSAVSVVPYRAPGFDGTYKVQVCAEEDPDCDPCTTNPNGPGCGGEPDVPPYYNNGPYQPVGCTGIQCQQSTLVGGLGVSVSDYSTPTTYLGMCTIGALAQFGSYRGFITASHCSSRGRGTLDGTYFSQGDYNLVGQKLFDPPYQQNIGRCYPGYKCRYSDVQFASFNGINKPFSFGYIVRPAYQDWNDPTQALFVGALQGHRITYERRFFDHAGPVGYGPTLPVYTGDRIDKVGARTGRTSGLVRGTCIDIATDLGRDQPSAGPFELLCQSEATRRFSSAPNISLEGDSGGPVTSPMDGSTTDVWLNGLVAAGDGQVMIFSQISYAVTELRQQLPNAPFSTIQLF